MWVRTQLKISYIDLMATVARGLKPPDRGIEEDKAERYFSEPRDSIACFSVRSGFDLLLQSLNLKSGDEVVFSALNVRAMIKVVNNLGLVPIPVDVDLDTMQPRLERLQAALTPKSKVFVAAHLFGTRLDLEPTFALAKSCGLITVEDCAQAFNGRAYQGSSLADVVMFSFGPIKTATALGGALFKVRDQDLLQKMRDIQSSYPVQPDRKQRKRAVKFIGLKLVTTPSVLGAIYRYYRARGKDYEDSLAEKVRDVAPLKTVENMRLRPSGLMLWLMNRRLYGFKEESIAERTEKGRSLTQQIRQLVRLPGQAGSHHDYWVYPILTGNPKDLIKHLRENGFDAADLPRSQHIAPPADRPELEPERAASLMRDIVIVPCYEAMPDRELNRLANAIQSFARRSA